MFATRGRTIVTIAVLLELGIAGWTLGHGALWFLVATVVVTMADTLWGLLRRHMLADVAGLEIGLTLTMLLLLRVEPALSLLLGGACLAWLIRPERQSQPDAQATGTA